MPRPLTRSHVVPSVGRQHPAPCSSMPTRYIVVRHFLCMPTPAQVDFPYHYSSILYACYGNQYKVGPRASAGRPASCAIPIVRNQRKQELRPEPVWGPILSSNHCCCGVPCPQILQLVEREYAGNREELVRMHTTRCWMGKNSAMVGVCIKKPCGCGLACEELVRMHTTRC